MEFVCFPEIGMVHRVRQWPQENMQAHLAPDQRQSGSIRLSESGVIVLQQMIIRDPGERTKVHLLPPAAALPISK